MIINKKLIQSKGKCWFAKKTCTDFFLLLKLCESTNYGVFNDYTKTVMKLCSFLKEYYHESLVISALVYQGMIEGVRMGGGSRDLPW